MTTKETKTEFTAREKAEAAEGATAPPEVPDAWSTLGARVSALEVRMAEGEKRDHALINALLLAAGEDPIPLEKAVKKP
jgi:hypothetical protein